MSDKVLRWYIDGVISRSKTEVGGTHILDADYRPEWVHTTVRVVGSGSQPLVIDVNDDGTTIFGDKPALTEYQTEHKWTTIPGDTLREDSIITCDIDQTFNDLACRDLTVELGLQKV